MNKLIKQFNTQVLKLSWVYIIAVSLLFLIVVQLYRNTANPSAPATSATQLEQKIQRLEKELEAQRAMITSLESRLTK